MKIIKFDNNTIAYFANVNKFSSNITVNGLNSWQSSETTTEKLPKWDLAKIPLKYYIENSYNDSKFLPQFINIADNTFFSWMRASNGLIKFQRIFNKNNADILLEWTNTVVLGRDNECGHNDLKVVNNKIEKAQITIVVYPEIDKGITIPSRLERVRRTALHEIGHSLGLNHSQSPDDMMFYRGINNKTLSLNDVKRLNDLYSK